MQDYLNSLEKKLKEQDRQIAALNEARQLADEGNVEKAITIAEKIMYENKLVVKGRTLPFILADLYLEKNMNDKCWGYLNYIFKKFPDMRDKVRKYQTRILTAEGKHLEAMAAKMAAYLLASWSIQPEEWVEKSLSPFIERAKMTDQKKELLILVFKYKNAEIFNENAFNKELNSIINLSPLT